jgi:hypothetical protein
MKKNGMRHVTNLPPYFPHVQNDNTLQSSWQKTKDYSPKDTTEAHPAWDIATKDIAPDTTTTPHQAQYTMIALPHTPKQTPSCGPTRTHDKTPHLL